jgi:hypothetical protein
MKKQLSLLIGAAALIGALPAYSATNWGTRAGSSVDLTGGPATRTRENVDYTKYQTRTTTKTYEVQDGKNMYYTQPANRSALYKQYSSGNSSQTVRTTRSETVRTELKRKYYLAHPFFQPLQGKFGSITDFGYNMGSYDIELTQAEGFSLSDSKAAWDSKQFAIKEDFSYGITDRIAVLGLLRYEVNKYTFDWSASPDDKDDDNGLNMYGLGAQWRFVDTADWIATASAYFQHQKDIANNFILDLKAGYKVSRSTIYGLARAWYVDFDGDAYGNGIKGITKEDHEEGLFVAYNDDAENAFYIEGGLGVFSVLDEDWTLNVEGIFGHYDWHNQFSIKGAIGWQPNDWFALNLYAKTTLFDSADDQKLGFWWWGAEDESNPGTYVHDWIKAGDAKLSDYRETSLGLQVIFQF